MQNHRTATGREGEGLRPDPAFGRLLTALGDPGDYLPWPRVERLVAEAPPVLVPWYASVFYQSKHQLRYAAAALMLLLLGTGVLAMVPAQSDQVGTLILTKLPSAWSVDGPAFGEAKQYAQASFRAMDLPQSEMHVIVGERAGRDELAFVLLGADAAAARSYVAELAEQYPALGAFDAEFQPLDTGRFGSRLREMVYQLTHRGRLHELSDNELMAVVLRSLTAAGIRGVENVTVTRRAGGKIVIVIEAALELELEQGRTREDLTAAGVNEELLGVPSYERLLDLLAAPDPE